jgi:toxin ParE1/3/4
MMAAGMQPAHPQAVADNPQIGPARPDLRPGFRYLPVGNYLILYRVLPGVAEIVRVVHGARHLPGLI